MASAKSRPPIQGPGVRARGGGSSGQSPQPSPGQESSSAPGPPTAPPALHSSQEVWDPQQAWGRGQPRAGTLGEGAAGLTRQAGFVSEKDKRSHLRAQNHMWKVTEAGSLDVLMAGPGPRPPPGAPHGHGAGASTGEGSRGLHPTGALLETPGAVRQGAGEPQYQRKRPTSPPGPGTIQRAACEAPEWPPSGQGTAHPSGMQSLGARPADQIRISRGGALGMEGADLAGA